MVTAIVCSLIIGFLIGCVLATAWCKTPADDFSMWKLEQERRMTVEAEFERFKKYGDWPRGFPSHIEAENNRLKREIHWLEQTRCPIGCMYKMKTCSHCSPKELRILAKTPSEQEVIDLLQKAIVPLDALKEKFGINL